MDEGRQAELAHYAEVLLVQLHLMMKNTGLTLKKRKTSQASPLAITT
jgi:hypothetical protein